MNNEYDNDTFFEEYAKMPRSRDGLIAAGEWHQLKTLFPVLYGKKVLDLGCGYGWHCKFAAEQGAAEVLGIDLSRKNQLPRCKHSSTVSGSYVASHSTCLLHLLTQVQKRGMKVSLSLPLHIIE